METPDAIRHGGADGSLRPIVAFDFDGTLTVRDSFKAFLVWRTSGLRLLRGLARLTPAALRYALDRDRERLKTATVAEFLAGAHSEQLAADADDFCSAVWDRFMRPDALATWAEWGRRGALRVIVTASPDMTVSPFARRLGADALIGTKLAVSAQGLLTGAFSTPNCRGQEKVVRLRQRFGADVRLAAAYGDTAGDVQMLSLADAPGMKVFTGRP